jgi:hypothetical protein
MVANNRMQRVPVGSGKMIKVRMRYSPLGGDCGVASEVAGKRSERREITKKPKLESATKQQVTAGPFSSILERKNMI